MSYAFCLRFNFLFSSLILNVKTFCFNPGHLAAGHSYQHALLFNAKERLPRGFAMVYRGAFLGQAANLVEVNFICILTEFKVFSA